MATTVHVQWAKSLNWPIYDACKSWGTNRKRVSAKSSEFLVQLNFPGRPSLPPFSISNNIFLMVIDGSRLPTNMRQRVANGTLYIETVQRNVDNGTYTCTARNKHNFTSHRAVEVIVLGKFETSPSSLTHRWHLIEICCIKASYSTWAI